ncbi:EAL domain-containing protein [Thiomicrorhabdus sp. Kp2]|uniref:two-component system response regulator n=1 Tax=Thiomicrorhabdus sp. Kp2 TaxID=1123518 RepID=UPI00040F5208|nr:EAL domain-containing protein [Thiomicrorhabdus sp. Kp2]
MPTTTQANPRILIIEDDPVTRLTLRKVLAQSDYEVFDASNGREGFTSYIEQAPNLVIVDAMMPEMNGYETIQAIRKYEQDRAIPLLMLTALDDVDSINNAFDAGATDFITKPINWGLLTQRVKYALRSAEIEEQLRSSQAQLVFAQKLAKLGYWEWDAVSDRVTGSQSAFSLFGVPKHSAVSLDNFLSRVLPKDLPIIQQAVSEASNGQSHIQISFRVIQQDGNLRHIECLGEVSYDSQDKINKITGSAQDISRLHKAETLIHYQSKHDTLTELPNRVSFNETLTTLLSENAHQQLGAVLIFDIDRFKQINKNLGQEQGDNLLISLAQRLNRITREGDFVARIGSDEFAILLPKIQNNNELNLVINRFRNDLNAPFIVNNKELFISYSCGVSVFPDDATDTETLIEHANSARTNAKSHGGNQFIFYRPEMNDNALDMLTLENDLRKALKNNEIEVFYQPQVHAKTLEPIGSEALVRWRHPTRGIVSPVVFIPLAESTGMIIEIGRYVLETAIKQTEIWHNLGYDQMRIGINLSSRQFTQSNLMQDTQTALSKTKLPSHFVDLEITESLAMSDAETNINILSGLKAMGVSLSIDDFGTGYSSLAYLHSFPIDTIKIDRSFVLNLDTPEGQAIAKTILAMAESLNLEVVAEGIELDEQVTFFADKHCDIFQGYKFGKPMPHNEFTDWLKQHHSKK